MFLVQVRWLILVMVVAVLGAESFTLPPLPPLYPIIPPPIGFLPYFVAAKGTLIWASKYTTPQYLTLFYTPHSWITME
jgi:hypothetical protein